MANDAIQLFDARRSNWCDPMTGQLTREAQIFVRALWLRAGGATGPSTTDIAKAQFEDAGIAEQLGLIMLLADGGRQNPPTVMESRVEMLESQVSSLLSVIDALKTTVHGLQQGVSL